MPNVVTTISEQEKINPDMPAVWQVRMEFSNGVGVFRTWTVDAPSQLVATVIQNSLNNMTDATYDTLYDSIDASER